jgi:ubiquinone/menaquinone biosynthesis C-methylase UbiE
VTDEVRDSYDAVAELYARLFLRDLDGDTSALDWLARFAKLAARRDGVVADVGCGPGHVVRHLSELGLAAVGYDISAGQIAQARQAFPDLQFHVGDFAALDVADASLGGVVARYSLIHLPPPRLSGVFKEWMRALEPGAPVLVSFFASTTAEAHGTPFDHKVATAYALFPATIAGGLLDAGFVEIEIGVRPPPDGGRPFDQGTVLALKPCVDLLGSN